MESESLLAHPRAKALLARALQATTPQLDVAAAAVAALEYPEIDLDTLQSGLNRLAARVQEARPEGGGELEGLQALRRVLADEEGFRGNTDQYQDPQNSFVNCVLERRLGLPISLSVVYLEVARRAGIPLYGVSFPAHFVVAANVGQGKLVLDPFNDGNLLTEAGCEALLKEIAPQLRFHPRMLSAASVKTIVYRMLGNLKRTYLKDGDGARALRVVDLMLHIAPDHPGELRARAAILSTLGAYRAALADIERCLQISPDAPDHESLLLTAQALRQRVEFLN